jgi:hypothetical protein
VSKVFENLLNRLFRRIDIADNNGSVYLRRWYIWPRHPEDNKDKGRLYLHKFYRGDNDRHLHDHPWAYQSLILKGGYWEHSFNPAWIKNKGFKNPDNPAPQTVRKWYGPGSYIRRGDRWAHQVELDAGKPCWTLFVTEKKSRSWGFHTENGWCWWKNYHQGVCWCYEPPNEVI